MQVVMLTGNVGRDPETKFTKDGLRISTFSVAVKQYKGDTVWWRIKCFGDRWGIVDHITKGMKVAVVGEYKEDKYTNKEGEEAKSVEVSAIKLEICSNAVSDTNTKMPRARPSPNRAPPEDDLLF